MIPNPLLPPGHPLNSEPPRKSLVARWIELAIGPTYIGGSIGFLVSASVMLFYYFWWDPKWNATLIGQCIFAPGIGCLAGAIGGATARDESMIEAWGDHRMFVGLFTGVATGLFGLLSMGVLVGLASVLGGALGAVTDVYFHGDKMEEDW